METGGRGLHSHSPADEERQMRSFYYTYLAIISFSLLEECPPLPKTLAGVERKYRQWFLKYRLTSGKRIYKKNNY